MSSIRSSSACRQRIQPTTAIAPPIAPPYQTRPDPEKTLPITEPWSFEAFWIR
jgi:hypothetical protein